MGAITDWGGVAKRLVTDPGGFYDELPGLDTLGPSLRFAAISSAVLAVQLGLLSFVLNLDVPAQAVTGLIVGFVLFFVLSYLVYLSEAVTAHVILVLMGADGSAKTFEAYAYPTAIRTSLGLIPIVNLIAGLYGIYLQYLGVKRLHGLTPGKSIVAVLVALFVSIIVFWVFLIVLLGIIGTFVLSLGAAG